MHRVPTLFLFAALTSATAKASVNDALDVLYESGANLKSLAADVSLKTEDSLGNDKTKTGTFVMQRLPDGDSRIRATFTKTVSGDLITREKRDYLLAGQNLIERDYAAKPKKKQTTRKIREPGEKIDLFKLGQGPFPLPIGQKREDVLREFDVEEIKNDNPKILAVVKLSPKKNTALAEKFKSITVTVEKATKLPSVIETTDPNATETNTVTLTNVRSNADVKDDEFKLEAIDPEEWNQVN